MSAAEWFLAGYKLGEAGGGGPITIVIGLIKSLIGVLLFIVFVGVPLALLGGNFLTWLGWEAYGWGHPFSGEISNRESPLSFDGRMRWDLSLVSIAAVATVLVLVIAVAASFGRKVPQMIAAWALVIAGVSGYYFACSGVTPVYVRCTTPGPRSDLEGCRLQSLAGLDLSGSVLRDAELVSSDLSGTNLTGASLRGATLRYANLTGADLTNARLEGADLSGVLWTGAICPDGRTAAEHGGACG